MEQIFSTPPVVFKILTYNFYCDQMVNFLVSLCKRTHQMCYKNMEALIGGYFDKRVVVMDNKEKTHLMNIRIAYFKVKISISNYLTMDDLKKFIHFFDVLELNKGLEHQIECYGDLNSPITKQGNKQNSFEVVNKSAFFKKKMFNLFSIN